MMEKSLLFREKLEQAGANEAAIVSFLRAFGLLEKGTDFSLPEAQISAATDIPEMEDVLIDDAQLHAKYISQAVVIKLNGGLGTSMGLKSAKSLLEVKDGRNFFDLIVQQNNFLQEQTGQGMQLLMMNSFSTSKDTLDYLSKYPAYADAEEVEMLQNFSPKIERATLTPARYPADEKLEWCPPGHGDLYTALYGSGWLDKLLDRGINYAFVANSDNLGAIINPSLLTYFAESGCPFLMEVTRRTLSDNKGGHLARRLSDGQLLLREVAQCPDEDLEEFQDITKHSYFNTNNLWLRLDVLKEVMSQSGGVLPLPIITNKKTVDPRDADSTPVYQLETAMGAAIECFQGAAAVCVPRRRFAPVKKTSDLLALRSDAYEVTDSGRIILAPERNGIPPVVSLCDNYKFVDQLTALGVPSLREAKKLSVKGKVTFQQGVTIKGDVYVHNDTAELLVIPAGVYENVTLTPDSFQLS